MSGTLRILLTVVQVVASAAIIGLVLLQRGKGAEAGAGFGAGASGTVFGARGATTALSRATAIFAAIFMLNSLALAYMGTRQAAEQPKTILDEAAAAGSKNAAGKNAPVKGAAPATAPAGANGSPANGSGSAPAGTGAGSPPATAPSNGAPSPAPTTAPAAPTTAPQK